MRGKQWRKKAKVCHGCTHPCHYVRATHDQCAQTCTAPLRWRKRRTCRTNLLGTFPCSIRDGKSQTWSSLTSWAFAHAHIEPLNKLILLHSAQRQPSAHGNVNFTMIRIPSFMKVFFTSIVVQQDRKPCGDRAFK